LILNASEVGIFVSVIQNVPFLNENFTEKKVYLMDESSFLNPLPGDSFSIRPAGVISATE